MLCVRKPGITHCHINYKQLLGKNLMHSRLWTHHSFLTDHVSKFLPPFQALWRVSPWRNTLAADMLFLPSLLSLTPSVWAVLRVEIGKVRAGADLCVIKVLYPEGHNSPLILNSPIKYHRGWKNRPHNRQTKIKTEQPVLQRLDETLLRQDQASKCLRTACFS